MEDINRALEIKSTATPDLINAHLPDQIKHWLQLFIEDQESTHSSSTSSLRYKNKGWTRASSSPGGIPVLFVKKPGRGLRFCVDYRALNAITEKDRYPLPLIRETLRAVSKSPWITKVDVRATFHKLRVRGGNEKKMAFRTRFGSFEWLVTPFGLQRAPAAFQSYVTESLGDYLDNFGTAYYDDIIIYIDGDINDHWQKAEKVPHRLSKAGLQLDP
ncbi:hypothetical protein K3495_g8210 [Podosphaera aphanis]|nr:hypothetical protein K3495_g8210 [Podosphaera aphanis]